MSSAITSERTILGTHTGGLERERVYLRSDSLEVDAASTGEILRRRVLLEDVLMVTLHRPRRVVGPMIAGMLGLILFLVGIGLQSEAGDAETTMAAVFLALGGVQMLGALIALLIPGHAVTVFGRRGRATLGFGWRGQKARQAFGRLCRVVQDYQRQLAATAAAQVPAPPPLPPALSPPPE